MKLSLQSSSKVSRKERGSALLLVLWAILLMSIAVMGAMEFINYSVDENVQVAHEFQAMLLAESGIALGLHPDVDPGDPVLKQNVGSDSGFEVTVTTEGSRIPINYLTNSTFRDAVYNLFVYWGLSTDEANVAADSLADWVDTDDNVRSQGAESDYYQGLGYDSFPRQTDFGSVDEMILVRGMDAVERRKPDWRNYFSTLGDGTVDVNRASKDVLMAVCDATEGDVNNLINERNGSDGVAGTEDDVKLTMDSAKDLLGLDTAKYQTLQSLLTDDQPTRRVESVGRLGTAKYKVVVIAQRQEDGSLTYLSRLEE